MRNIAASREQLEKHLFLGILVLSLVLYKFYLHYDMTAVIYHVPHALHLLACLFIHFLVLASKGINWK